MRAAAYAVVDVETTGFFPQHQDRILELAIVRTTAAGEIRHEYATLVQSGGPVGAAHIHHITPADLGRAPTFAQVARAVAARLLGTVVVGHNVAFDLAFLQAEYERLGVQLPPMPTLCTKQLAKRLGRRLDSWRLADCCADAGVPLDGAHTALGDARATAGLLRVYLQLARQRGDDSMAGLGCTPLVSPPWQWPMELPYSARQDRRADAHIPD